MMSCVHRAETCRMLKEMSESVVDAAVRPPRFVVVEEGDKSPEELAALVESAPFTYPLICKPIAACGAWVMSKEMSNLTLFL